MKQIWGDVKMWLLMGLGLSLFTAIFFNIFIIPVFPIIITILIFYATRVRRAFIKKATTPIHQLQEGLVKIIGTISAEKLVETPSSNEKCIGYSYEQAEVWYDDDGNEQIKSSSKANDLQDFYLNDSTGKILIKVNDLDLLYLIPKIAIIGYTKHTERVLRNGDTYVVLGFVVKNNGDRFEVQKQVNSPFYISTIAVIEKHHQEFRLVKYLLPYIMLMYLTVNYFLFFATIYTSIEKYKNLIYFGIFGLPLLALLLAVIGNKFNGIIKLLLTNFAGILLINCILTIPLLLVLAMANIEFYRILCIWFSVFLWTTLGYLLNQKRIEDVLDMNKKIKN